MMQACKLSLILISLVLILTSCDIVQPQTTNKPIIVISFDDEHVSTYTKALPIMQEYATRYNCRLVASNTVYSGGMNKYGHMSWQQLTELTNDYEWEVFAHSLNHNHLEDYTNQEFIRDIETDLANFQEHGLKPSGFSLPNGHATFEQREMLKKYFPIIRTSLDQRMKVPLNQYDLGYFFYSSEYSYRDVIDRITTGINNNEDLIILGFHRVYDDINLGPDVCTINNFREIMDYLCRNDLKIMTIKEAVNYLNQ